MTDSLEKIAKYIVSDGKGILAADESNPTCTKRFDSIGVESTEDNRRDYRELLFSADGMEGNIGGVILYDETIRQTSSDGTKLIDIISANGALPGIKVDKGLEVINDQNETITKGLEDLDVRCKEYNEMGAKFTKWRSVINIGDSIPSYECINQNMDILAKYAKIAQNNNMVPIVEPEVLINGVHDIHRAHEVSTACLSVLFEELEKKNVLVEGCILKPSMITPGMDSEHTSTVEEVARMTIDCLKNNVPDSLPGITFLSGGQTELEATEHLNAMNQIGGFQWKLSFSYGRALQQSALKAWQGLSSNKEAAQQAFSHRAKMNKLAALGQWNKELETK